MAVFANLRKGADEIKKAASSSGRRGGFIPNLSWKDDQEKHYVLFLQSIDDIPTVLYHKMMDCGTGENGKTMWRSFISRRDPAIDGPSGYDPLDDRGYKPTNRSIAIVCEMEPVMKGSKIDSFVPKTRTFERKTEDGGTEEVTEPAVYLVIESPSTFFSPIRAHSEEIGPIEDQVFLIRREGKDQNTTYSAMGLVGKPFESPENIDEVLKRLEDHVEELADENRMRDLVESQSESHVFNRYAKRKGGSASKSKSSSGGRFDGKTSTAKQTEPEARADNPAPAKKSRFDELRSLVEGQ